MISVKRYFGRCCLCNIGRLVSKKMDSLNKYHSKWCKGCRISNNLPCYWILLKDIILQNEWPEERKIANHMVSCYCCKKLKAHCEKPKVDLEKKTYHNSLRFVGQFSSKILLLLRRFFLLYFTSVLLQSVVVKYGY